MKKNSSITRTLLFVLLVLLASAPAFGDSGKEMLSESMDNYFYAEFDLAIEKGKEALGALEDEKDIETAYKVIGFSYIAIQKESEGVEYFKKVVRLSPTAELDPMEFSPKLVKAFNKAKEMTKGKLAIISDVANAEIEVDSVIVGKTVLGQPFFVKLPMGSHRLRVFKDDYKTFNQVIPVGENEMKEIQASLEKIVFLGDLEVLPNVSGGKIFVDGEAVKGAILVGGKTFAVKKLFSGKHTLLITLHNYISFKREFEIVDGALLTRIEAELEPIKGQVGVVVNKVGTEIFIGKISYGKTTKNEETIFIKDLQAGGHTLVAKLTGHKQVDKPFILKPNEGNSVHVNMVPENMILIKTDPAGADIFINGEPKGLSPLEYATGADSLLTIRVEKKGYEDGNIVFEYSDPAKNEIHLHLVNLDAQKLYFDGLEAEDLHDENFNKYLVEKTRSTDKLMNNYFAKAISAYQKAVEKDPFYSMAYVSLGRMYFKKILKIRTNKLFIESEFTGFVEKALEYARNAIELNNDSLAYALAFENNGNVMFHRGEIESDFEKKLMWYKSAIRYFDDGIKAYKIAMEKPEFDIAELERTYFNRAVVFEKMVAARKKNKLDIEEHHMEEACNAWQAYDYPDRANPDDPFNPTVNPLREKAKQHTETNCDFY